MCGECKTAVAVGPCAACELMICGDCGVTSRDPVGIKVICVSCARLIANVRERRPARRSLGIQAIAIVALIAFGLLFLML